MARIQRAGSLSLFLSFFLSLFLFFSFSLFLSLSLSLFISLSLSPSLSLCLSLCFSLSLSVCVCVCVCVPPSQLMHPYASVFAITIRTNIGLLKPAGVNVVAVLLAVFYCVVSIII